MGILPARRFWLTPSSFPHAVEASHLAACRGSRVCFACLSRFPLLCSSHSAELETLFSFEQRSLGSVQCSRPCFRHSCPSLFCLLFSVANFPFALPMLISSSRSPRLTHARVPSQLGDRIFGTGNSHFGVDGQMAAVTHDSVHFDGSSACGYRQTQDTMRPETKSDDFGCFGIN